MQQYGVKVAQERQQPEETTETDVSIALCELRPRSSSEQPSSQSAARLDCSIGGCCGGSDPQVPTNGGGGIGGKACKACGTNKALHDFWRNVHTDDGRNSVCKDCKVGVPMCASQPTTHLQLRLGQFPCFWHMCGGTRQCTAGCWSCMGASCITG